MSELTLGSLFDGSGGFPLGGILAGIRPVWASEIEPFPIRVTTKRMPFVKHYGDVSAMDGGSIEPVDIITFGSPCQDMSIAGKRSGLSGSRSSLFFEAVRIIKEMRNHSNGEFPKYIVWENVPGALSSGTPKGGDFHAVLTEICRICDSNADVPFPSKWYNAGEILGDHYSVAWRILDASMWGVPQRRNRIYLVADLTGGRAGKVLFESEGMSGYSAEGFRAWQSFARYPKGSSGTTSGIDIPLVTETTPKTMKIRCGKPGGGKGALIQNDISATISTMNDQTLFQPVVYGVCAKGSNSMKSDNPNSGFYEAETSRTLDANGGNPICNPGGMVVIEGNGSRPSHQGDGYKESDTMYTLNATEQHGVAYGIDRAAFNQGQNAQFGFSVTKEIEPTIVAKGPGAVCQPRFSASKSAFFTEVSENKAFTLMASDWKDPPIVNDSTYGFYPQMKAESVNLTEEVSGTLINGTNPGWQNGVVSTDYIVRRLTPVECARLQGFPDAWCNELETPDPTEEDIVLWEKIWETHRNVIGTSTKPKTRKQLIEWLKHPYSDSSAYKLWGNGVALPNVWFVLSGIVWANELSHSYLDNMNTLS